MWLMDHENSVDVAISSDHKQIAKLGARAVPLQVLYFVINTFQTT